MLLPTFSAAIVTLCFAIGAVGPFHRRLKQSRLPKIDYVALAWTGACVGTPALDVGHALDVECGVATVAIGGSVFANLVASNPRAGESLGSSCTPSRALSRDTPKALASACALLLGAALATALASGTVARLASIPAAQWVALFCFRESERFARIDGDGALLVCAALAISHVLLRLEPGPQRSVRADSGNRSVRTLQFLP